MDAKRIDALARWLAVPTTRRTAAHALAVGLGLLVRGRDASAAPDPDDRCKRVNEVTRGQACELNCNCKGNYQCGRARTTPAEREICGQPDASRVCCRNRGDTCHGNDCECCGELECLKGRCAECLNPADCPPPTNPCQEAVCDRKRCSTRAIENGRSCGTGKICQRGACVGNGTCSPGTAFANACGADSCGDPLAFPNNTQCLPTKEGGLTCVALIPDRPGRSCERTADCPSGAVCVRLYPSPRPPSYRCAPLCVLPPD